MESCLIPVESSPIPADSCGFQQNLAIPAGMGGASRSTGIKSKTTSTYEILRYPLGPSSSTVTAVCETIDVDSFDELLEWSTEIEFPELTAACKGILIEFPAGKNHHTSYPFGLHNEQIIPWDYHSVNDDFYIQAKSCQKPRKK